MSELVGRTSGEKLGHLFAALVERWALDAGNEDAAGLAARFNTREGMTPDDMETVLRAMEELGAYWDAYQQVVLGWEGEGLALVFERRPEETKP